MFKKLLLLCGLLFTLGGVAYAANDPFTIAEEPPPQTATTQLLPQYALATSNATSDVTIVAADANNYLEVGFISATGTNATTSTAIKLCDGACSTSNYLIFPLTMKATTSTAGFVAMLPVGFQFRTSAKNHALVIQSTVDVTSTVTVTIIYRRVRN